MKAIILKEIRELAPGAALAILAFTATFTWGIYLDGGRDAWAFTSFTTSIGFPLLAAILGVLQTLPEKKNDRWAYLLHRPLTHNAIFTAKTIAGLSLYFIAAAIPTIIILTWLATPGNLPMPFYWPMVLPAIADILIGPAYYFAAIIISMSNTRWYGSRIFPISLAIITSLLHINSFSLAVLIALIPTLMLALTARGLFISGGSQTNLIPTARFNLTLAHFTAIIALGAIAIGFSFELLNNSQYTSASYSVNSTGKLHITTWQNESTPKGNHSTRIAVQDITDPQNTIDLQKPFPNKNKPENKSLSTVSAYLNPYINAKRFRSHDHLFTSYYNGYSNPNTNAKSIFHWLFSKRQGLLLGYAIKYPHKLKQIIGPDGPHPNFDSAKQRFDIHDSTRNGLMLTHNNTLYNFDPEKIKLNILYKIPPGKTLHAQQVFDFNNSKVKTQKDYSLVLFTNNTIEIIDYDIINQTAGQHALTIQNPYDQNIHDHVSLGRITQGPYTLRAHPARPFQKPLAKDAPILFKQYETDGSITQDRALPNIKIKYAYSFSQSAEPYIVSLLPPGLLAFMEIGMQIEDSNNSITKQAFAKAPAFLIILILSFIASLAITQLIAKRYAFTKSAHRNWLIANALMGLAGPIVMYTIRDWPPLIPCHSCQEKRPADTDNCPACDAPFPSPQTDGTEILAA